MIENLLQEMAQAIIAGNKERGEQLTHQLLAAGL